MPVKMPPDGSSDGTFGGSGQGGSQAAAAHYACACGKEIAPVADGNGGKIEKHHLG